MSSRSSIDSSSLNSDIDIEFTLEDVYDTLHEAKKEREQEIENLLSAELNNVHVTLNETITHTEALKKQQQLVHSLLNQIKKERPNDYPVAQTSDIYIQVINEMENEVHDMQELFLKRKEELKEVQDNITYLEYKKTVLQDKEEICLGAMESIATETYTSEVRVAYELFKQVKKDLQTVVTKLFPNQEYMEFADLLADLTAAYTKGGDDVYIEVNSTVIQYMNFLLEADLITHHRNDKSKIKLVDLS